MRAGRLILVVATLVTILVFPLLMRDALSAVRLPNAYAAPASVETGGRVYQNGNNDDDDNDNRNGGSNNNNNNSDDEDEDNDNFDCYANLNENETVPCDDNGNGNANDNVYYPVDNGNANDNDYYPPPPPPASSSSSAPAGGSVPSSRTCVGAGQAGDVMLVLSGGSIIVKVVPEATFTQSGWIELDDVDPATVPAPPAGATVLDSLVWQMNGATGCDASASAQLTGPVNLGIPYNVSANKSKLQVVYLRNGVWEEVPTSADPDPNKPYISATVRDTGVYAVIQKP